MAELTLGTVLRHLRGLEAVDNDYASIVRCLVETVSKLVGGACALYLATPDARTAQAVAAHEADDAAQTRARSFLVGPSIQAGRGAMGRVLTGGETPMDDAGLLRELNAISPSASAPLAFGHATVLPLTYRSSVHGLVVIARRGSAPAFSEAELELVQVLLADTAHRIHRNEEHHALRRSLSDLRVGSTELQEIVQLIDSVPVAFLRLDPTGRISFASAGASKMLGYARKELLGSDPSLVLDHGSRGDFRVAVEQAITLGESRRVLVQCRTSPGMLIWVVASVSPLRETALDHVAVGLENVDPWMANRSASTAGGEDPAQSREAFLQVVVHELRTPLNALKLSLESVRRRRAGDLPPEVMVRLDGMARQIQRLSRFMGHVDASEAAFVACRDDEHRQVDLVTIIRAVIADYADDIARTGSEIQVDLPAEAPFDASADQLERVVANLIDNALKFGGSHPIEVRLTFADGIYQLSVRDYGFGMSADDQKRIFDRYVRVVSDQHFGGLGLGLWIARRFVEAHHGTIAVDSSPGAGSTFTVRLPARAAWQERSVKEGPRDRWAPQVVTQGS